MHVDVEKWLERGKDWGFLFDNVVDDQRVR